MYKYFPRNYHEILDTITPKIYIEEDLNISSLKSQDLLDSILQSIIYYSENSFKFSDPADYYKNPLLVSGVGALSGINSPSGMLKYFEPHSELNTIRPDDFELEILKPLGYSLKDFDTSTALFTFIRGTIYNKIGSTPTDFADLADKTASAFGSTPEETHEYLANSMGLWYFLAYQPTNTYSKAPRNYTSETIARKLSQGQTLTTADAVKDYFRYLWNNYETLIDPVIDLGALIPSFGVSGTGIHTSGTQGLDRILTLVDVLYKEGELREKDRYVKDVFDQYVQTGYVPNTLVRQGPFSKFMRAVSYMMGDIDEYNAKIKASKAIDDCPEYLLPYLGDIIGWKFYGANSASWRRQLRSAITLYKKKGTKDGLIKAFTAVLPGVPIDLDTSITEMYESYIPNLMYYLLVTESPMLSSLEAWTFNRALKFNQGEYAPNNLDTNIRYCVDHIMLRAVEKFPEIFNIKGYPFDVKDPNFLFNYRDRDFHIPPWEEEKFYMSCDLHEEVVKFFRDEIVCLGVPDYYGDYFENYVLDRTIRGFQPTKRYENTFLFFTDTVQFAPNYERITKYSSVDLLKYLTLWSGKSSHFDFTLSGSSFEESTLLDNLNYSKEDFFAALGVVNDFTPAKAVPRVHFDLTALELAKDADHLYPKVKYSLVDFPTSGVMASQAYSGLDMRHPDLGLLGAYRIPSFTEDPHRTHVSHQDLPVFKREQSDYWQYGVKNNCYSFDTTISSGPLTVSGPYDAEAQRTSIRRRDFSQKLSKGENYLKNHTAGPNFYLSMSGGEVYESLESSAGDPPYNYLTLGLDPRSGLFAEPDIHNLKNTVWDRCENIYSPNIYGGASTSATYEIRGPLEWDTSAIDVEREHHFVDRSNTSEVRYLLFKLIDQKIEGEAEAIFGNAPVLFSKDLNSHDIIGSIKARLWEDKDLSEEDYFEFAFNTWKPSCRHMFYTVHRLYDFYMRSFDYHRLSDKELEKLVDGGGSIISHAYGPIAHNAGFRVLGPSSLLFGAGLVPPAPDRRITTDVANEYENAVRSGTFANINGIYNQVSRERDLVPGKYREGRTFGNISGVELVDKDSEIDSVGYTSKNKFMLLNLSDDNNRIEEPNFLHNRYSIIMKSLENFPRLRFNIGSNIYEPLLTQPNVPQYYGDRINKLLPEHEFTLTLSSQFLREFSNVAGGGSVGVWIHTIPELDTWGNYVFWNYMPDGKWKLIKASTVHQKKEGVKIVKNELSHRKYIDLLNVDELVCYENLSAPKSVLLSLKETDLDQFTIKFNTKNRNIKCPPEYYRNHKQVHREDQNYVIEVFPENSSDTSRFWITTGINVRDEDLYKCTFLNHYFKHDDYSRITTPTTESSQFIRPDNTVVPFGTLLWADSSGGVYEGDTRLTLAHTLKNNLNDELPKLYKTAEIYTDSKWIITENIIVNVGKNIHEGYFSQLSEDKFSPSSVKVLPKDLGTHIIKDGEYHTSISPQDMMVILRFFKSMSDDDQSRFIGLSERVHGEYGGSRLNYRIHPGSYETTASYETRGVYNTLEFTN